MPKDPWQGIGSDTSQNEVPRFDLMVFWLGNQYLNHRRGKKKQIYFFLLLLCKIFRCNFSLNMLGPANQYPIYFFSPPFGERLGLNTAGCLERKLQRSGSRSGVSCRPCAAGRSSRELFLGLSRFADCSWFPGVSLGMLWPQLCGTA